jgi:hypothetical protein
MVAGNGEETIVVITQQMQAIMVDRPSRTLRKSLPVGVPTALRTRITE